MNKMSPGRLVFQIINYTILVLLALSCLLPLLHVLALSFSSSAAATAGRVGLFPVNFTTAAYKYVIEKKEFWRSVVVSVIRVAIGVPLQMAMTVLVAFPLSREARNFKSRTFYIWFFLITMLFSGGLIPTYMTIQRYGLMNTIWALVLPGIVPVYHVILMMNFFRELPKEFEEAAFIDGAGYMRTLVSVYLPLSKASLATITLFTAVGHWNEWFSGIIYMNSPSNYPLQSYLQTVIIKKDLELLTSEMESLRELSDRTNKAAQIFVAMLPIISVYPFLQKHFAKGIVLGGVKG